MKSIKSYVLFFSLFYPLAGLCAWTSSGGGIYYSNSVGVTGFRLLQTGDILMRFSENTSVPCNGSNFILLNGATEKATANLYSFALIAKTNQENIFVKFARVGASCNVLELRSN